MMKHSEHRINKLKNIIKSSQMTHKDERTVPTLAKSLFNSLKAEGATPNEMMELVGTLMDLIAEELRTEKPVP